MEAKLGVRTALSHSCWQDALTWRVHVKVAEHAGAHAAVNPQAVPHSSGCVAPSRPRRSPAAQSEVEEHRAGDGAAVGSAAHLAAAGRAHAAGRGELQQVTCTGGCLLAAHRRVGVACRRQGVAVSGSRQLCLEGACWLCIAWWGQPAGGVGSSVVQARHMYSACVKPAERRPNGLPAHVECTCTASINLNLGGSKSSFCRHRGGTVERQQVRMQKAASSPRDPSALHLETRTKATHRKPHLGGQGCSGCTRPAPSC